MPTFEDKKPFEVQCSLHTNAHACDKARPRVMHAGSTVRTQLVVLEDTNEIASLISWVDNG